MYSELILILTDRLVILVYASTKAQRTIFLTPLHRVLSDGDIFIVAKLMLQNKDNTKRKDVSVMSK